MSKPEFTQEPWKVGEADWNEEGDARYVLLGRKTICAQDARLITAAPDMYEALKAVETQRPFDATHHWDAVAAALAKVEGRK